MTIRGRWAIQNERAVKISEEQKKLMKLLSQVSASIQYRRFRVGPPCSGLLTILCRMYGAIHAVLMAGFVRLAVLYSSVRRPSIWRQLEVLVSRCSLRVRVQHIFQGPVKSAYWYNSI
jgi:hypothetical protein